MSFGPPVRRTPVVLATIVLLVGLYIVFGLLLKVMPSFADVYEKLVLNAGKVMEGEAWRLLSYGFLHSLFDPFHVVMNGLILFFFARDLEVAWGKARLVAFLLGAVVFGGVCVVATGALGIGSGMAVGFSAAGEACLVAWALRNRHRVVNFFFLPPMRGIWVMAIAVFQWLLDAVSQSPMSASAHFGGIVVGLLVGIDPIERWRDFQRKRERRRFTVVPKQGGWVN
jgi:membrane associated rhomboid family serine protease